MTGGQGLPICFLGLNYGQNYCIYGQFCHFGISTPKSEGLLLTYSALNAHVYLFPSTHTHTQTQTHSLLHLSPLDNICKHAIWSQQSSTLYTKYDT